MKRKYVTYTLLAFLTIVGYNAFLISRDSQLFKVYFTTHHE
jgi:hypothetical protein